MNKNKDRIRADKEVIRQLHISIATADKEFEDRKIQVRKSFVFYKHNFSKLSICHKLSEIYRLLIFDH